MSAARDFEALRSLLAGGDDASAKAARKLVGKLPRAAVRRMGNRVRKEERAAAGEQPRGHLGWGTE
jgi:hypothetical protein